VTNQNFSIFSSSNTITEEHPTAKYDTVSEIKPVSFRGGNNLEREMRKKEKIIYKREELA
jgi:hypothetical protein